MKLSTSLQLFDRAVNLIPGGVNSPVRACKSVGAEPVFIDRGAGCEIFDVDGNRYIDYIGSWGPLILGHRHPAVMNAIISVLERGTSFGAPIDLEVRLAEMVIEAVPSVEMIRMVNSGTEATMSAVRLARGATQRDVVVKFDGCYHGHADTLLVAAGSGVATLGSDGILHFQGSLTCRSTGATIPSFAVDYELVPFSNTLKEIPIGVPLAPATLHQTSSR